MLSRDVIFRKKPSRPHNAANQPGPSNVQPDAFQPYVYEPNAKANQTIIKHVFQSPEDLRVLHSLLGVFINFEFLSSGEPKGVKFYPAVSIVYIWVFFFLALGVLIARMAEKFNSSCVFILPRESDESAIASSLRSCQPSVYHFAMG